MTPRAIDPVCGLAFDEHDAAASTEYQGRFYYFCSRDCLEKFQKDPERYAGREATPAE